MTEDSRRQIAALVPKDEASLREYRRIVGGAVEVMIGRGLPPPDALEAANCQSQDVGPWRMTRFLLALPAQGEELPAIRLRTEGLEPPRGDLGRPPGQAGAVDRVGRDPAGRANALEKGFAVLGADLFGQGEFTADGRPLAKARLNKCKTATAKEHWGLYAGYTFGYNRPLFSQRVRRHSFVGGLRRGKDMAARAASTWSASAARATGSPRPGQ